MKTNVTGFLSLSVLATVILAKSTTGEEAWWAEASGRYPAGIEKILGQDIAAWRVTDVYKRETKEIQVATVAGTPVLKTTYARGILLTHDTQYPCNTEVAVRFRYTGIPGKAYASLLLRTAVKDLAKRDHEDKNRVYLNTSFRGGYDYVSWSAPDPRKADERVKYARGYYRCNGIGDRQLNWPEHFRKIIEHETASLRALDETWFTLRIILRENGYQLWLNDLLAVDYQGEEFDTSGSIQISMSPYAELAWVRTRPLPQDDGTYVPVTLDHSLNAEKINGRTVQKDRLPQPGKPCLIGGIPFTFPETDDRGHSHLDIEKSWFQGAYLEGHLYGHRGVFSGRWADPSYRNPARIRFLIPPGRYRAIHLIAAADDGKDCVPVVTAQFYRTGAGWPASFAAEVPALSAKVSEAKALPVSLDDGKSGNLYVVTIPVEPGTFEGFRDLQAIPLELTKGVKPYRAYPDPSFYSVHAAGLPSSVHVYAMTLERPAVEMTVTPEKYAHVFTAPEQPAYSVELRTRDGKPRKVELEVRTVSFDGEEKTTQKKTLTATAKGAAAKLTVPLKRFGYHDITFALTDGEQVWNERLSLAHLHQDTREHGNWDVGRGPFFGIWCWRGGHYTPPHENSTLVHALAGGMGQGSTFQGAKEEVRKIAEKYGMMTLKHFAGSDHWVTAALIGNLRTMTEEETLAKMVEGLAKIETEPSKITRPWYVSFFAEPHLGLITSGALPEYFGEEPYQFTEHEEKRFQEFLRAFLLGAPEVRKRWPKAKIMMPHGDPMFTVFFARHEEARKYIDGLAVDIPVFERLPEQQIHQVSPHRLWICMREYEKAGILDKMSFPMYEGPCVPDHDGAVPWRDAPALVARNLLVFLGYGVNQFLGAFGMYHSGDYWGEQHYGGGLMYRLPLNRPKAMYPAYATITRQLNGRNFAKWLPTGSLSTYNMQFKHYQDGSLTHVLWTIRGTRPVAVPVPAGTKASLFDNMDNETALAEKDGKLAFTIGSAPVYLQGLDQDAIVSLGEPDHSDQSPGALAQRLSNLGDGSWRQSSEEDATYTDNNFLQIRRFPARMVVYQKGTAPAEQGGQALTVHFPKPAIDRVIMPYYTTLVPKRPITVPGKASHLGLWVKASSDWGRVVYSLRDAEGERWISVGTKDQWNCDDTHNWSVFCFDGWRYLRFEMPANSPYDTFRERGTTWWGHHEGDGIVDLPLKLEKVLVERRTHAMYVNQPVPANMDNVLLADLYAEYESEQDRTREAIRLSKLRMPVPEGIPALGNPIGGMAETGTFESGGVTSITLPEQRADGTQCYVHFDALAEAKGYDLWVSPYEDGRGALQLGKAWAEPGKLLRGLRPDTDFYLFLVVTDKDGKKSKPSEPYKIRLKDVFGMK